MKEKKMVVGFWLRVISDLVDAAILGGIGFLLSIPFKSQFIQLGEHGIWVGVGIAFLYTGILQSNLGGGQSLAKRIFGIQVLHLDGSYLNLYQSGLRYSVLSLFVYGASLITWLLSFFPSFNSEAFSVISVAFVFSLFTFLFILMALDPLKRGIHDFLVGSVVVRKKRFDVEKIKALQNPFRKKVAFIICGLIFFATIGGAYYYTKDVKFIEKIDLETDQPRSLEEKLIFMIEREIEEKTQMTQVSIDFKDSTEEIVVVGFVDFSMINPTAVKSLCAENAVKILTAFQHDLSGYHKIKVIVASKGFDIGIWSYKPASYTYYYSSQGDFIRETRPLSFFDFFYLIKSGLTRK
ncbi:MAG: RDD family protein [Deltaproteobacteria bacterium]|nr:RDD family protein [Deltaproteobacteria bacterium]